jgi:hypothetical protein
MIRELNAGEQFASDCIIQQTGTNWALLERKAELIFSADPAIWRVLVNRGQLPEVDWTRAAQPNVFGFIRCAGGSAAWPPGPGA